MAEIVILRKKGTGEEQYPRTYTKAVVDENGNSIDTLLNESIDLGELLKLQQGDLSNLETSNKNNLVEAINEAANTCGSGGLSGFKYIDNESQLPLEPNEKEKTFGYVLGENLLLYVETGGDVLDGKYKNVGKFQGPKGDSGVTLPGQVTMTQELSSDPGSDLKIVSQKVVSDNFKKQDEEISSLKKKSKEIKVDGDILYFL